MLSEAPKSSIDLATGNKRNSDTDPLLDFENKYRLNDSDFLWLRGKSNERAIFWCWLYVMYISKNKLLWSSVPTIPVYKSLKPVSEVNNTEIRSKIIISFYNELSEKLSKIIARGIYKRMSSLWSTYVNPVRRVHWLKKKSAEDLDWAWDYLIRKPEFSKSILHWFNPVDDNEKRLVIIAAIDSCDIYIKYNTGLDESDSGLIENMNFRKTLLNEMRLAYAQKKRREINKKKGKRVAINAEINPIVKDRIVEMANVRGIQINKLIENLINNEYIEFKKRHK